MAWLYLVLASVFEIGFTTSLRYTNGFKNVPATVIFLICTVFSLLLLNNAARTIPLGTAYAIWTGIGVIGTVVIGMIWFGEPATILRGFLLLGIIGCAVCLKLTSGH